MQTVLICLYILALIATLSLCEVTYKKGKLTPEEMKQLMDKHKDRMPELDPGKKMKLTPEEFEAMQSKYKTVPPEPVDGDRKEKVSVESVDEGKKGKMRPEPMDKGKEGKVGPEPVDEGKKGTVSPEELEAMKSQYTYRSPELTEEESEGKHMPDHLKCDACRGVSLVIDERLQAKHKKNPHMERLTESELYEAFEEACDIDAFRHFGVKEVNGKKMLSGPGMHNYEEPGILMAGGSWANRLLNMCSSFVEKFEEETIYSKWTNGGTGLDFLEKLFCYNKRYRGFTDNCIKHDTGRQKKEEL